MRKFFWRSLARYYRLRRWLFPQAAYTRGECRVQGAILLLVLRKMRDSAKAKVRAVLPFQPGMWYMSQQSPDDWCYTPSDIHVVRRDEPRKPD